MRFELVQPQSIEEALSVLSEHGDEAIIIAGGQSLLLMIRAGLVRPKMLVSINGLPSLTGVEAGPNGHLRIGALATHGQIWASEIVRSKTNLLVEAVGQIGSTPVRNFGTIGGNLCHNEMGSDPPAALLVMEAVAECVSPGGRRKVPLKEFFTGYFETCLRPDEILVGIDIPPASPATRAVYLKYAIRPGDLAIVGVAALFKMNDGYCEEAKLALGGVDAVPFRAVEAEQVLRQQVLDDRIAAQAAEAAAEMSDPLSDAHASAGYRRKMVRVFVQRAIQKAMHDTNG